LLRRTLILQQFLLSKVQSRQLLGVKSDPDGYRLTHRRRIKELKAANKK